MPDIKKFVVVNFQACFEIDNNVAQNIQSAVDDLRSSAAGRVTGFQVLEGQAAYDNWYHNVRNTVHEIELPSPGTITVRVD